MLNLNWIRTVRKDIPAQAEDQMTHEQHQREIEEINRQRVILLLGSEQIRQDYRR